jgi:hypothetical protein
MPLKLNSTGGGSVTLDTGSTASTYTLTLPSATATLATTASPTFTGTLSVVTSGGNSQVSLGDTAASSYSTVRMYGGSGRYNFQLGVQNNVSNAFEITPSTAAGGTTFSTPALVIDSSGNVGIGTSSPANKLNISGTGAYQLKVADTGGTGGTIQVVNASTGTASTDGVLFGYDGSNDVIINNQEATALKLYTSGSERARITSDGRFYVNQTGQLGNTLQRAGIQFAANVEWGLNITNSTTSTGNAINFTNSSGTQIGQIQNTTSATSYVTSSDYRLKENVAPITNGLTTISALKPVTYDWIGDKSQGEGFIAHELQEFVPLAVTGQKDAVDANGNPVHQGVDYSKIVVHLVAAIQELSVKNDALEARLAALEAK